MWTIIGGGDTQTLLADKINLNIMHPPAEETHKLCNLPSSLVLASHKNHIYIQKTEIPVGLAIGSIFPFVGLTEVFPLYIFEKKNTRCHILTVRIRITDNGLYQHWIPADDPLILISSTEQ